MKLESMVSAKVAKYLRAAGYIPVLRWIRKGRSKAITTCQAIVDAECAEEKVKK